MRSIFFLLILATTLFPSCKKEKTPSKFSYADLIDRVKGDYTGARFCSTISQSSPPAYDTTFSQSVSFIKLNDTTLALDAGVVFAFTGNFEEKQYTFSWDNGNTTFYTRYNLRVDSNLHSIIYSTLTGSTFGGQSSCDLFGTK